MKAFPPVHRGLFQLTTDLIRIDARRFYEVLEPVTRDEVEFVNTPAAGSIATTQHKQRKQRARISGCGGRFPYLRSFAVILISVMPLGGINRETWIAVQVGKGGFT
jgi:hypothetical protein